MQIVGVELLLVIHGIIEVNRDDVSLAVAEYHTREPRDEGKRCLITELAYTREQTNRGTVGPGSDHRTHELVHQIEELRPDALTETIGLTIIPRRHTAHGAASYPPSPYPPRS